MDFLFLTETPLFRGTTAQDLEAMLACLGTDVRSYEKGQMIYRAGEVISSLGVILSGSALIENVQKCLLLRNINELYNI